MPSAVGNNQHQWGKIRKRILQRDGGRCVLCGARATEVDHVVPRMAGGSDEWHNLQSLCRRHHAAKSEHDRRIAAGIVQAVQWPGVQSVGTVGRGGAGSGGDGGPFLESAETGRSPGLDPSPRPSQTSGGPNNGNDSQLASSPFTREDA